MKKDNPSGLGGWLILPLIHLFITPLSIGYRFVTVHLQVFKSGAWNILITEGSQAYHPLWAPTLLFEIFTNIALGLWAVALLVLLLKKSPSLPKYIIRYLIAALVINTIILVGGRLNPVFMEQKDAVTITMKHFMRSLLHAMIWIPYFLKSRRVKNTFIHISNQSIEAIVITPVD